MSCCEQILEEIRGLAEDSAGLGGMATRLSQVEMTVEELGTTVQQLNELVGILPRVARLEAQVREMQNGENVDLSPVLNQLSQLRSQVSGISGEIQSSENRIIAAVLNALSGIEALFRTILAEVLERFARCRRRFNRRLERFLAIYLQPSE